MNILCGFDQTKFTKFCETLLKLNIIDGEPNIKFKACLIRRITYIEIDSFKRGQLK